MEDLEIENGGELLIVSTDVFPPILPYGVPLADTNSFVNENGPLIESAVISTNYVDAFEAQNVLLDSVDFIPNLDCTVIEEKHLVLFI